MHARQSSRVRSLARTRCCARSGSTAAAVKPPPPDLGKWARPQPTSSQGQPSHHAPGKWEPPLASYQPNVSKWARPVPDQAPRRSILDALDVPTRLPRRPRPFDERRVPRSSSAYASPQFPAAAPSPKPTWDIGANSSHEDKLRRDLAPHLAGNVVREEATNDRETNSQPSATAKGGKDVRSELQELESERTSRSKQRAKTVVSEYTEDYRAELNGRDEKDGSRRVRRVTYKERGSVIQRLEAGEEIEIPYHSRTHQDHLERGKKTKKKAKDKTVIVDVAIPSVVSVENLSRLLGVRLETLQNCMRRNDMEESSTHDHMLSADDAALLAMEFDRNPIIDDEAAFDLYAPPPHPDQASLPRRPPIVTIMGHVDHGKTTLLDTLRSSSVAKGEAGGITQHIGAFSVPVPATIDSPDSPHSITFLDTPGHAAFSAMRARGAQVTDIIVLVVAADDGVMPQTKEVIELIKKEKGKVGVVVAINKVDKPGADVETVQNALWAEGIELEVMGGDVPSVEVSGLTGQGLENLTETISLLAELQDIRSDVDGSAHGYILESKVVKGFGNTATVLLLSGKLTPSSHIISGTTCAKVRRLVDSSGATVKAAGPGTAVMVSGWKELPSVGDEVLHGKESDVKLAVENRRRKASLAATLTDAEAINSSRRREREERERKALEASGDEEQEVVPSPAEDAGPKELRLIIKGDVSGSVEALAAAVEGIGNKQAITKVVSTGVGEVTESDVMLAKAAQGMIIAFSVKVSRTIEQVASQNEVPIHSSNVIYNVLDEVKERIIDLLPKIVEKRISGEANVLEIFDISGKAKSIIKVAGCRVSNGIAAKDKRVQVVRNGEIVHDGTLSTLRILKRDVLEVKKGLECGINVNKYNDLRAGDLLQFYQEIEKPGQL